MHSLISATENIAVSNYAQTPCFFKNHYHHLCQLQYQLAICYFDTTEIHVTQI